MVDVYGVGTNLLNLQGRASRRPTFYFSVYIFYSTNRVIIRDCRQFVYEREMNAK